MEPLGKELASHGGADRSRRQRARSPDGASAPSV